MWNLDDPTQFARVLSLQVPWAHTWADMRPGKRDKDRREQLRRAAAGVIGTPPETVRWWAFRISVRKGKRRPFDVENVAKPIIDAFCARQIREDESEFGGLGLYPDDSLDSVRIVHLYGERGDDDATTIEIFAFIG